MTPEGADKTRWISLKDNLEEFKAFEDYPTPFLDLLLKRKNNDIYVPPKKERDPNLEESD